MTTTSAQDGQPFLGTTPADLASVLANWNEHPRCQVIHDDDETTCELPARWRWNFHGCSAGLMCQIHYEDWTQTKGPSIDFPDTCPHCGCYFTRLADLCTFIPL